MYFLRLRFYSKIISGCGNIQIKINFKNTETNTLRIPLRKRFFLGINNKYYLVNITYSILIYICAFVGLFFLKYKSLYLNSDNLKLLNLFFLSIFLGSILSKKFSYIKLYDYGKTLSKLFRSLLISLASLIILVQLYNIQHKMPAFLLAVLFCGIFIESVFFIVLGKKEKRLISFFKFKNLALRYLVLDFAILLLICSFEIITHLLRADPNEKECILIGVLFINWLFSAATTHKFLPTVLSDSRWGAFDLQLKFYLKFIVLSLLAMIFLRLEYSSAIHFIRIIVGYSFVSSITAMFIFAAKIENKIAEPISKFLSNYKIDNQTILNNNLKRDIKYSFNGTIVNESVIRQKLQFSYLKNYNEVFLVLDTMLDLKSFDSLGTIVIKSDEPFDNAIFQPNAYHLFVNLHVLNDQKDLNKYLSDVRGTLVKGGVFVGALHPHLYRYHKYLNKYSFWIGNLFYFFNFIWKRVFPKLPITRTIFSIFNKDKDNAIDLAEGLGRLVYSGYKILNLAVIDEVVYFAALKDDNPIIEKKIFYSPIFKMKRTGKNGKMIYVYKLRTMYPYSEYIQEFVFNHNELSAGGKFNNDFRIPCWGRLFRKHFIDELPMLFNWIKGDLKLVGVRPISNQYLGLYSADHQRRRKNFKPGLVPPFYVDMPKTIEEIELSEKKYLDAFEKNPIKTDIKYLIKAVKNILIKKNISA